MRLIRYTEDFLLLIIIQEDVPSLFYYNDSHVFGLSVIPKNESNEHDIPTKLQLENRFLVAGTLEEIFILPCKETALRCSHQGITTMNFTYNPAKPATQFETYLKLTFTNQMKRVGLLDEEMAADFNFTQIKYNGRGIHEIISKLESERFILPRDIFLELNTKEDEQITGGKRGFVNEKIYQDE
ncbi:uncharacterized protein LOC111709484 [Eurytemora carolleeae]|uniref:uncharacterized protein LOC111709484 n=1 Tax=Eurytemora carolleeae TaxID=1294199 RepID=UPI000C75A8C4|nr:uncharacterized protein LOC111709484 [Eurytemora carolleeae]|eukprot:XP_023338921.1 uncharacterized protein LOC111709484 [Eurytemora affinis]